MAPSYLPAVICLLLIHSLCAVPQPLYGPRNLAEHVQHYLDNGGHEQLQKAFGLGPDVYFNPLVMFERDDIPPSQSKSQHYASDLQLLRALSVHIPGVDPIHQVFQSRQTQPEDPPNEQKIVLGAASEFAISYTPDTPADVRNAVEFAVEKWAQRFQSEVRIRILFKWASNLGDSTLGAATSPTYVSGGDLRGDVSYSPALASAIQRRDVSPSTVHVTMVLNRRVRWHLDFGRRAPFDRFDLATTVLHELTHGLFFSGSIAGDNVTRTANFGSNRPGRFDQFMRVEGNIPVARVCARNETNLFNAVTNPTLRFVDRDSGANFALFAPGRYQKTSSSYHFESKFLPQDCQSGGIEPSQCSDLMTHQLNVGYTQQEIGETTFRVLRAMRSDAVGVLGTASCNLPDSPLTSEIDDTVATFTLPSWGIVTVAVVAGVGALMVVGVVFSSVAARKRAETG